MIDVVATTSDTYPLWSVSDLKQSTHSEIARVRERHGHVLPRVGAARFRHMAGPFGEWNDSF